MDEFEVADRVQRQLPVESVEVAVAAPVRELIAKGIETGEFIVRDPADAANAVLGPFSWAYSAGQVRARRSGSHLP
jgi:hypothetical protein